MTQVRPELGVEERSADEKLVADRIRRNVQRATGRSGLASMLDKDLRALHSSWDIAGFALPPGRRGSRRLVTWVRRVLYRLMYPVLQQESAYAGANTRVVAHLVERLNVVQMELGQLRTEVSALAPDTPSRKSRPTVDMLALENAFRGSEDEIRHRQARYAELFRGCVSVLDVGCGRGEFLSLLKERGVEARGVDIEPKMVDHCRKIGLNVTCADATELLHQLADESLGGIFSAQVIEHMQPPDVLELITLCSRKLRPGGKLLLESPNPESLSAVAAFYIDFTHVRMYHPEAIKWFMSQSGFEEIRLELSLPVSEAVDALRLPPALARREPDLAAAVERAADLLYGPRTFAAFGIKS